MKTFLATLAFLALSTVAHAAGIRDFQIMLPDGSRILVVEYQTGGMFRHSTRMQMAFRCTEKCDLLANNSSEGAGAFAYVSPIGAAAAIRPTRVNENTNVSNGSSSASAANPTVGDVSATQDQVSVADGGDVLGSGNSLALGGAGGTALAAPVTTVAPVTTSMAAPVTTVAPVNTNLNSPSATGTQTCSGLGCSNH